MKLLAVASTFPAGDTDPVPAFVKEQLVALKQAFPELLITVLAPHDRRSRTEAFTHKPAYDEYRFHYFWPANAEILAGRGIMPALRSNPLNYLLIPFLFVGEFLAVLALTKKLKPDVIYAHWFTPQGVVCSLVGRITRTPFVFTTHASDVDVWRKIPLAGRVVVRYSATQASAFTAVSRRSMDKLKGFFSAEQWLVMQQKGAIIPMGVTMPDIRLERSTRQSDQTVILFIGRLVEKKGVQYLLQAFAAIRTELGNGLLVVAGDGPMLGQLRQEAAGLGLGKEVQFAGFVTGAQKADLLRRADLYVVPSIVTSSGDAEGLPVSLMEGLAGGKVCIATVESGADEILSNGRDGYLIPGKDVAALASALLAASRLDPVKRSDMEAAARQTAVQFDWTTIARRHYEFLLAPFGRHAP